MNLENNTVVTVEPEIADNESVINNVESPVVEPLVDIDTEVNSLIAEIEADEAFLHQMGISSDLEEEELTGEKLETSTENSMDVGQEKEILNKEVTNYFITNPNPDHVMEKIRELDDNSLKSCIELIESGDMETVKNIFENNEEFNDFPIAEPKTNRPETNSYRDTRLQEILEPINEEKVKEKLETKSGSISAVPGKTEQTEAPDNKEKKERLKVTEAKALLYYKEPEKTFLSSKILFCRKGSSWDLFSGATDLDNNEPDPARSIEVAAQAILNTNVNVEKELDTEQEEREVSENKAYDVTTHYLFGKADTPGQATGSSVEDGLSSTYYNPNFQWFSLDELSGIELTKKAQESLNEVVEIFKERDEKARSAS